MSNCPDLNKNVGNDSTKEFNDLWRANRKKDKLENAPLDGTDIGNLQQYQILFVKGFLSDIVTRPIDPAVQGQYFDEQMAYLKNVLGEQMVTRVGPSQIPDGNGQQLNWGSQLLPIDNGKFLRHKIRDLYVRNRRKIIIISHSKGGVDTLHTLLDEDGGKLLGEEIVGWISMQTPFEGTPIANELGGNPLVQAGLKKLLDGHREALDRMSETNSCEYLMQNQAAINEIGTKINFLAFASWASDDQASALSVANSLIKTLADQKRNRANNDGLVPTQSAILKIAGSPVGNFISVEGFDHAVPVMPWHLLPKVDLPTTDFNTIKDIITGGPSQRKDELNEKHDIRRENFTRVLLKIWLENGKVEKKG